MSFHCVPLERIVIGGIVSLALLATGCGGGVRYPVDGRLLLEGKPLTDAEGAVVLKPDASKGNTASEPSVGVLQRDGRFNILTNGETGAAPGWYKVIIIATEPDANPNEDSPRVLNERYEKDSTTPLSIEVVANPGPNSYDLQLVP